MRSQKSIVLNDGSGKPTPADLITGLTLDEVDEAMGLWSPYMSTVQQHTAQSAQHSHWDWSRKARSVRGFANYLFVGVFAAGEMQGLMLWDDLYSKAKHPSQLGKDVVYVNYLATAPWNDRFLTTTPRFIGVGSVLLLAATQRSVDLDYKGRLGLHALPQADGFYRNCGLADMGHDSAHENLRYFEFTPDLAEAFFKKIGG